MEQKIHPVNKPFLSKSIYLLLIVLVFCSTVGWILRLQHHSRLEHNQLKLPEITQDTITLDESPEKNDWQTVLTRPGDTLSSIFKRQGLSNQTLLLILQHNPHSKFLTRIKPKQKIQMLIHDHVLETLIFPLSATQYLQVSRADKGYISKIENRETNSQDQYITATVKGSLYATAKRLNLPNKVIKQMTDILNWEIDFAKEVRSGDQFTIIYEAIFVDDKLVNVGDIVAVSYTNQTGVHQAIKHETSNGDIDYYTPKGTSLKKAFSRYPVKFSHISSTFSLSRKHPILHYSRPHKGIDLAAPIGTPIHATGNGVIQFIGRHHAYGNMVKIAHNKTYTSLYAHLLKFQKGLSHGDRVKRGDIIGYVGQSGLATGPHCHYEFHVNQQPRNPSTIALPRAEPVQGRELAKFKTNTLAIVNRLKLYESAHLVAARTTHTGTANKPKV